MKSLLSQFRTAVLTTLALVFVCCGLYPLAVFAMAQALFPKKANGSLIASAGGSPRGSRLIGQPFSGEKYFHPRPSAAGNGYDAANSSGSNYAPTSKKLIDRVATDAAALQAEHPNTEIPIDLVTASGSGLDPHITPAAAEYQLERIAQERRLSVSAVRDLIARHTEGRQFGFLGEPRVNVLELNLDLDRTAPFPAK